VKKTAAIALHRNELDGMGISLNKIETLSKSIKATHRDDHYMFILQRKGEFLFEIDFRAVKLRGASLCFVAPGQVHRYIKWKDSKGWFIFADVSRVPETCREIFDTWQKVRQLAAIDTEDIIFNAMPVLEQLLLKEQNALNSSITGHQVGAILGLIASKIIQPQKPGHTINGQRYHIASRFKQLVKKNYKDVKQVQQYAERLNITPLYLNEVVKEITGFTASYWIQQEIILEAKRLLYYTVLDVKQIAYELGYEDHTYFSRFFKKNTGMTALAFRKKNHDMSNQSH
jgi:AraC family transcriptional regulator, transcriptional activator of pobA